MRLIRKINFLVFYLRLKWLRTGDDSQGLGDIERRLYAEAAALSGLEANQCNPDLTSARDCFWILGDFTHNSLLAQIDSLVITRCLKFGNAIIQLTNAVNVAKQLGISKIYHRGYDFLNDDAIIDGVVIQRGIPKNKNCLASSFFPNQLLGVLCVNAEPRYKTVRKLAPFLKFEQENIINENSDVLYIHIRSGDIFSKSKPHPAYGQPPLSFYKKIILSHDWRKIVMIFENLENPVIEKLIYFLESKNIFFEIQSTNIMKDMECILSAENIVIGYGTFVYPIICLSNKIRKVFFFEKNQIEEWGLDKSKIQFTRLVDSNGGYRNSVLKRWINTDDQKDLMLNYPEENIEFQD
jgi:hypothetical protein